jgi:chemotaxis protein MotB
MGKRHKHPEHENLERWLVSYADFITLLFATFVVLYALSQADLAKFKDFAKSVRAAFNQKSAVLESSGGVMQGDPDASILKSSGNSILDKLMPRYPENAQVEGSTKPLENMITDINKHIAALNQGSGESVETVELKLQERGIVVRFPSNLFFDSGRAGLKPEAYPVLDKLVETLQESGAGRVIHVEGHTDNQPITTAVYPSNWELSSARASSVVRYFIRKHKFDPKNMAAVGYAESRPLGDNKTVEGRQQNRRVDVVILFSSSVADADAGVAQKTEQPVVVRSSEAEGAGLRNEREVPPPTAVPELTPSPEAQIQPVKGSTVDIKPKKVNIFGDPDHPSGFPDDSSVRKIKPFGKD